MAVYFVDSSALVKRYRNEEGSQRVIELIESADRLMIARLTPVEVSAALVRRGRATRIDTGTLQALLAIVDRELKDYFDIVQLDDAILTSATALTRKHALRAANAMQLACALAACGESQLPEFAFIGSDRELNAAVAAEGILTIDPTDSMT